MSHVVPVGGGPPSRRATLHPPRMPLLFNPRSKVIRSFVFVTNQTASPQYGSCRCSILLPQKSFRPWNPRPQQIQQQPRTPMTVSWEPHQSIRTVHQNVRASFSAFLQQCAEAIRCRPDQDIITSTTDSKILRAGRAAWTAWNAWTAAAGSSSAQCITSEKDGHD
jgi:hypothetical protein